MCNNCLRGKINKKLMIQNFHFEASTSDYKSHDELADDMLTERSLKDLYNGAGAVKNGRKLAE